MLVWAVASQKGGVGKTTTVATLAGWLQQEHLRVLVIDTDPHASLTSYLGFDEGEMEYNLFDLYAAPELNREMFLRCTAHTALPGLDIIPAAMSLATIDRQLSGRQGVGRILTRALTLIEDCYDVVLIDCPPVLGALMVNALVASTIILVPTQTEFLALKGLHGMVRTFDIMQQADSTAHFNYIIVPTMFDKRTNASLRSLEFLKNNYQEHIWPEHIPIDTRFRESSARALPLSIMDKGSRGSQAYLSLLRYLIDKELTLHKDKVSPALAAVMIDDEVLLTKKRGHEDKDKANKHQSHEVVAQSVKSMVSTKGEA